MASTAATPLASGSAHRPRLPAVVRMVLTLIAYMAGAWAMVPVLLIPGAGEAMSQRTPLVILVVVLVCGVSLTAYLLAPGSWCGSWTDAASRTWASVWMRGRCWPCWSASASPAR